MAFWGVAAAGSLQGRMTLKLALLSPNETEPPPTTAKSKGPIKLMTQGSQRIDHVTQRPHTQTHTERSQGSCSLTPSGGGLGGVREYIGLLQKRQKCGVFPNHCRNS